MADSKLDRRGFLAGAAGLTGVALSVGAWKPVFAMETGAREAVVSHQVKIGHVFVQIGDSAASSVLEAEGGSAYTDVLKSETAGSGGVFRQFPGRLKWAPITLKRGITADNTLYNWIKDSIGGNPAANSGLIGATDENFKLVTQTSFFNALITEVGFPALDAASKDAAKMTIKFQPEFTRMKLATGQSPAISNVQQKATISNFKLTINGMNTSFVTKIDSLNVKLNYAESRDVQLESIDIPNMKITVPEAQAKDFISWHEDFVINGRNGSENEKTGSLAFLSTDLKTELFRLDLSGLGIFALDQDPLTASNSIRNMTAQLYCDKMIFNFKI